MPKKRLLRGKKLDLSTIKKAANKTNQLEREKGKQKLKKEGVANYKFS